MSPFEQAEQDELSAQIKQELSQTPYSCSVLTQLNGGTVNFVFRGTLARPFPLLLDDGSMTTVKSVIIKHSRDFVAINRDFPLDISRCILEEYMLNALNNLPATTTDQVALKAPRLYLFNRDTNIQVIEDFAEALDLKSILVSPTANSVLSLSFSTSIGYALGSWLRSFYNWASAPAQADLQKEIRGNEPMRKLKYLVTYDSFVQVIEKFPENLAGSKQTLEDAKEMATKEFERTAGDEEGEDWGIIHGDFWTGNVLLRHRSQDLERSEVKLLIIDWEFAQFGHRAYDLGQMIGDLYERKHFKDVNGAIWAIQGFMDGFGRLSDEMAFRTAIHAGVHLICWCNRRPANGPAMAPPKRIADVVKLGRDFVVKGWEKDRKWFEDSALAPLFRRN